MALYRKFVRKGAITNKLIYRGHEFVERWKKDVVLMCEGDTISKQVNNTFDNLSVKRTRTFGKDVRAWYFGDGRKTGRIKSDKGSGMQIRNEVIE